jgi:hypothetical protein
VRSGSGAGVVDFTCQKKRLERGERERGARGRRKREGRIMYPHAFQHHSDVIFVVGDGLDLKTGRKARMVKWSFNILTFLLSLIAPFGLSPALLAALAASRVPAALFSLVEELRSM